SFPHRDVSTRVAIRTQTQDKLQEANYFRHRLRDSGGNRDHVRWNLSAFLGAAYGVIEIMRTEYARGPGFKKWFKEKYGDLVADDLVSTLLRKRNELVHVQVIQIHGRHQSEINEALAQFEEEAVAVVLSADVGTSRPSTANEASQ